jgi:hypothetical protein
MRSKVISKTTTNRGEFNRAYKFYLERKGKIHCSLCKYHRSENYTGNHYGGNETRNIKFPNWKLVSKSKKQWMAKPMKIKKTYGYQNREYTTIKW